MTAVDQQKVALMQQIQGAWGDWERVAQLAEQVLQIDPECFEAETALQAAYMEIACKDAEQAAEYASTYFGEWARSRMQDAAHKARDSIKRALDANRRVRELAKKQGA